jgi:Ser/Thr protein kinase RdoA (MazF antagonist)
MNDIQRVLDRYPAECQPTRAELLGSAGGMSGAQFWRLDSSRGQLVLRRWPSEHPTADGLRLIHSVLRHVYRHGLTFVPVPLAASDGATFIDLDDHLWEVDPWLPGVADFEQSPRVERLRAAMTALAQFHVAAFDYSAARPHVPLHGPSPAIVGRLTRLRELQSGGIDALSDSITDGVWPDLAPLARQFLAALPKAVPRAIVQLAPLAEIALPLQPSIRDIWSDHVLFDGDTVSGLIDFGAMAVETPAGDVARLLGSLVGDDKVGWREGLAAYSAIRPLSEHELSAVPAFDTSGTLLAGCNWIRWIYIDGREFGNRAQVLERFRRIATRLRNLGL